ncbi:atrophin- protein [Spatholobus suberectus]|nr:atrophin- protein [Spatholobus suberectus]
MEAQPPTPSTVPPPPPPHLNYPDSVESSPRSRNTDSWDEPFAPASTKLRLMCSYGGHIVPRPHDKSLCYVGGDTRIIVSERATSLADLSTRLSKTFLNGRPFTLKYQLPNEDLDSLISVTTDEDLDNMIDEYDRTAAAAATSAVKPSRIRLFLFPTKPDSTHSIPPQILDTSAKSDDWFLNALNGAGLLNRGFSDSASVNCLLGLDDEVVGNNLEPGSRDVGDGGAGGGAGAGGAGGGSFNGKSNLKQDVHSVPDSPMLETTSSFGSTSSSPSLANLPPIRVHVVEDQKVMGIEEQFAQMGVGVGQKQDEGFVLLSSPPPPPVPATLAPMGVPIGPAAVVSGEYHNRVVSDDERSDHGVPVGYRKPPTPQPQVQTQTQAQTQSQTQTLAPQFQQKSTGGGGGVVDLPSPDSVSSDSSLANAISRPKPAVYQDQVQIQSGTTRVPSPKLNVSDPHGRIQMQQHVQDPGYLLQQQFEQQQQQPPQHQQQQQFIPGTHFIHHNPAISAYYPVYPSQQHPQHPQVYYVPARQTQAYNLPLQQANMGESAANMASSRPQTPPNPATLVPQPSAYNPIRNAPMPKTEMSAYRAATGGTPQLVQVPTSQHQQQYVTYSQMHHPSQSMAPNSVAPTNYAFDYADPAHAQIYYSQPLAPTMPSQYQTMTAAAVMMQEGSAQHPSDSLKQQIRTSQPL